MKRNIFNKLNIKYKKNNNLLEASFLFQILNRGIWNMAKITRHDMPQTS